MRSFQHSCFYPRPRAGGDKPALLTGGMKVHVSIHAPAQGATRTSAGSSSASPGFYPRPRAGGDAEHLVRVVGRVDVSIHAPAQGATSGSWRSTSIASLFLSTPPRRGRRLDCNHLFFGREAGALREPALPRAASLKPQDTRETLILTFQSLRQDANWRDIA